MMSEIVYQYQQAYVPNNGNTFHFWVDCTKEIHDEEAREGGTVRTLYTAPPAPVLRVPDGWIKCSERIPLHRQSVFGWQPNPGSVIECYREGIKWFYHYSDGPCGTITHWMPLPPPPETSNEQ